jgi:hypothetical protein
MNPINSDMATSQITFSDFTYPGIFFAPTGVHSLMRIRLDFFAAIRLPGKRAGLGRTARWVTDALTGAGHIAT